jgi:hypothetical protein
MMLHKEYFNHWYDKILNNWPFLLDDSKVHTKGVAWLFKEQDKWVCKPRVVPDDWQYANAVFFIRVGFPFSLFLSFRNKNKVLQLGLGWKQTGRFAIHCRIQTDENSVKGYHEGLSNTNLASGFDYGRH